MARVTVIGAGAIGSCFAAELLSTGRHQVTVLSRTPRSSLTVQSANDTASHPLPVRTRPDSLGPQDWILLATKTTQTARAAAHLVALTGPHTRVVVLQNGIESCARIGQYVQSNAVVECVVRCAAERLADNSTRRRSPARLILA